MLPPFREAAMDVDEQRFWARVDKAGPNGCWIWTGSRFSTGYGVFHVNRKSTGAHRVAYSLAVGPIPEGAQLDHLCRVRHCVNPAHLDVVDARENLRRSRLTLATQNASKTHCKWGHPFDAENTHLNSVGARVCRKCYRRRWRERYGSDLSERAHCPAGHAYQTAYKGKGSRHCCECVRRCRHG